MKAKLYFVVQDSPSFCVPDFFRQQEVAAEFVRVSMSTSKHVIVKLKGKHVYFRAEHVRPVVPDTLVDDVNAIDITTVLPANPADQHFVHPELVPLPKFLIKQQHLDRVQGVVLFVACNKAHGKIATLKHGVVSVKQSNVIGGGCILVGHWCEFNVSFSSSVERQATFVLLGLEAERRLQEEYKQASRQVDIMGELLMCKPSTVAAFAKHTKDEIAAMKFSSKNTVVEHASKNAAMILRKKKRY